MQGFYVHKLLLRSPEKASYKLNFCSIPVQLGIVYYLQNTALSIKRQAEYYMHFFCTL